MHRRGAHGTVVLAQDRLTGREVAVKAIPLGTTNAAVVERELCNQLLAAGHPNVVQLQVSLTSAQPLTYRDRKAVRFVILLECSLAAVQQAGKQPASVVDVSICNVSPSLSRLSEPLAIMLSSSAAPLSYG